MPFWRMAAGQAWRGWSSSSRDTVTQRRLGVHGPLSEVADKIVAVRAKARADHGWLMDIYLMRRRADCCSA